MRRLGFWIRSSSIAAAVFTLGGCAMNAQQQPQSTAASHLDAVQKAGVLRICTPGDYKPFSFQKADSSYEGIDVDLMTSFSGSLNAKPEWIKTTWTNLLPDLAAGKCDVAVGGVLALADAVSPLRSRVDDRCRTAAASGHADCRLGDLGVSRHWRSASLYAGAEIGATGAERG